MTWPLVACGKGVPRRAASTALRHVSARITESSITTTGVPGSRHNRPYSTSNARAVTRPRKVILRPLSVLLTEAHAVTSGHDSSSIILAPAKWRSRPGDVEQLPDMDDAGAVAQGMSHQATWIGAGLTLASALVHPLLRRFVVLTLACLLPSVAPAQVTRCVDAAGNVQYSNVGCPSSTSRSSVNARPNSVDITGMRVQNEVELATAAQTRRQQEQLMLMQQSGDGGSGGTSACPSEIEIRNMGVSAASKSLSKEAKEFHQAEIRRAQNCRRGEGKYSTSDWRASKEATAAQRSVSADVRERERRRVEAMHSDASPAEGERIREERAQEATRVAARRQAAAAAAAARAQAALAGGQITSCRPDGCFASNGNFYWGAGRDTYSGPNGFCRRVGDSLNCP